ncbi:MAG: ParA family protein [Myxococcota bacterium]
MPKIISVANQKGGVGKTTTSVNLAASLALAGKEILLIDMDPQANASSNLGFKLTFQDNSIYEVLTSQCHISEAIANFDSTDIKNLRIIPSKEKLAAVEVELVEDLSLEKRPFLLKEKLDELKELEELQIFDYIFIDCPPSLGQLTINALCAADTVLIPVQAEYFALEGLSRLIETVEKVKDQWNQHLEYEGILLCMTDDRTNLSKEVSEEIKSYFGSKVYSVSIPRNVRVAESPSYGKPVILYSAVSRGAYAYMNLADDFLKRNEE